MRLAMRGLTTVVLGLAVIGCGQHADRSREGLAAAVAQEYFSKLQARDDLAGWQLLHPSVQAQWRTYEAYEAAVTAADLSGLTVHVLRGLVCDDGSVCTVCLDIPNGHDAVPSFMRATDNTLLDGVVLFDRAERDNCGNALVGVIFGRFPWDPVGVAIAPHE
jgi:hypothetical protein